MWAARPGKQQTIYFVSIEFQGKFDELRQTCLEYAKNESAHMIQMESMEADARKQIAMEADIIMDDAADVDEFHPTIEERPDGSVVDRETKELVEAPPAETKKPKFPLKGGSGADETNDEGGEDADPGEGAAQEEGEEATGEPEVEEEEEIEEETLLC